MSRTPPVRPAHVLAADTVWTSLADRVSRLSRRLFGSTAFAPPVTVFVALTVCAFLTHRSRLGLDLAGGGLVPVGDLGAVWATYLEAWHAVAGGTGSAASPALAVVGLLGTPLVPIGGPAAFVALLLLGDVPLAALSAYAATRRLRVGRWVRAGVGAGYGLLPPASAGVAQGRLDVVVVHILLPAVLAGIAAVLTRADARLLSTSALCALALAVVGAFSPPAHVLALVALVVGFVVLPPPAPGLARRVPAVGIVVVLPVLLLVPWLPAILADPASFLLHGWGDPARDSAGGAALLGLHPGGPGAMPVGIVVVVAAVVAVILRPTRHLLPGLGVLVLGVGGVVVTRFVEVDPVRGGAPAPVFCGVALLYIGAGLLAVVLGACVPDRRRLPAPVVGTGAVGAAALLLVLAAGVVIDGRDGPLTAHGGPRLASSLTAELATTGRGVLVLGDVPRLAAGRAPSFGDDALVRAPGVTQRLARWQRELLAGSRQVAASVAAAGVTFVVLPPGETGARLRGAAVGLVTRAAPTDDGREVVRLLPTSTPVTLVSPEQARRAVDGRPPSDELMRSAAVAPVDARPPDVRVRVSDGPAGRLLVLAAQQEPGWRAEVDGVPVPIVPAWGHHVAVPVPARQSDVVVAYSSGTHSVLLMTQAGALLFAVLTAIPGRRWTVAGPRGSAAQSPSMMSGSTPR